jgi:hypothetical protein
LIAGAKLLGVLSDLISWRQKKALRKEGFINTLISNEFVSLST